MSEVSTTSSHANIPTTLTGFNVLPPEIRCKVWHASFPRRRVNLREGSTIWTVPLGDIVGFGLKRLRTLTAPHPVAAFFDYHEDENDKRDLSIPNTIYINPRLDTLYLTTAALTIWQNEDTDLIWDYMEKLFLDHQTCNPRCIEAVEELEIYCYDQEIWWYNAFVSVKLQMFTNLKRVILVRSSSTDRSTDSQYIAVVKAVYDTTDASPEEKAGWNVPEITVRVDDCAEDLPKVEYSARQRRDSILWNFGDQIFR
ncbi:hypothetical protein CJF30_00001114 [Rutstroemia sp. NJR-2017a BBW]|nr:hypothetical protein CJF30_00001114 [Rutstroemia sp. NJR-2017a BBW]